MYEINNRKNSKAYTTATALWHNMCGLILTIDVKEVSFAFYYLKNAF